MSVAVTPRAYQQALSLLPQSFQTYDTFNLQLSQQNGYKIAEKIGYGKYSDVFKGVDENANDIVIKILKPVKYVKVYREMKILTDLLGGPHIMRLIDCTCVKNSDYPAFITEYSGTSMQNLLTQYQLGRSDLRLYFAQLLLALDYCHQHGIIHRDVKGGNICINLKTKQLTLLDFGLAEFYTGKPLHHRVATRNFKSPELLLNYELYDYSLDIWSTAVVLAGYCFKKQPFFKGADNVDMLDKIVEIMGSEGLMQMVQKYGIQLPDNRKNQLSGYQEVDLHKFINSENAEFCDDQCIKLITDCLQYDPEDRPTARELLKYEYFKPIMKELVEIEIAHFNAIEQEVASGFKQVTNAVRMRVNSEEVGEWPIPISPNELLGYQVIEEDRWDEIWQKWQSGIVAKNSSE